MNKILGYCLTGVGLAGFIFFLRYTGRAIRLRELWFVLSISMMIAGIYFYLMDKWKQHIRELDNSSRYAGVGELMRTGEKIKVMPSEVEIKARSYQQEVFKEGFPSRIEMTDALYDSTRNYETTETKYTYFIFYKEYKGNLHKFVSNAFNGSREDLREYLERRSGVDLYVDPNSPGNYYFDFSSY